MSRLICLSLYNDAVTDMTPLAGLATLQDLFIYNNKITAFPSMARMAALTYMDVSENSISDASPVTALPAIQTMLFDTNQITVIPPMASLKQLTGLDFDGNAITDLSPVTLIPSLQWLSMESCQVAVIPDLSNMSNLTTLDLCSNQVTDISGIAGTTKLIYLFLGNEPGLNTINALMTAYGHGAFVQGDIDLMNDPLADPNAGTVVATLNADGVEVDANATFPPTPTPVNQ